MSALPKGQTETQDWVTSIPLLCTPNKSFNKAHTKLWWRKRVPLCIRKEKMGRWCMPTSPSAPIQPPVRPSSVIHRLAVRWD